MPKDWRTIGRDLEREWRNGRKKPLPISKDAQFALLERPPSFTLCLLDYYNGDPANLIEYLRSGREMPDDFREQLAEAISNFHTKKPKRGRPKDRALRHALVAAQWFFQRWRAENDRQGINDWGHREDMKDESIRTAIEIERHDVADEDVRALMDRATCRQK